MRPKLKLNDQSTSIKLLKSSLLEIKITDHDGKKINYTVKDAPFSDDEEFTYEFMVPPETREISLNFQGEVKNISKKKMESLRPNEQIIKIKSHQRDNSLHEMYLKQIDGDYYIYCLGKNGEPLRNHKVELKVTHKDFE